MGWWRLLRCWLVERVYIRFEVGGCVTIWTSPTEVFRGSMLPTFEPRFGSNRCYFLLGLYFWFFLLGSISLYSFEPRFGSNGCAMVGVSFPMTNWFIFGWDMVPSCLHFFFVKEVLSKFSILSVICSLYKESIDGLEFESLKLMVPVTVFGVKSYVPPTPQL